MRDVRVSSLRWGWVHDDENIIRTSSVVDRTVPYGCSLILFLLVRYDSLDTA
jgi:hypothetical protein